MDPWYSQTLHYGHQDWKLPSLEQYMQDVDLEEEKVQANLAEVCMCSSSIFDTVPYPN
jgi:hypothetical protein